MAAPETFTPGFPPRKLAFYAPPPFFYDSYTIIRPLNALCFVCCVSVCVCVCVCSARQLVSEHKKSKQTVLFVGLAYNRYMYRYRQVIHTHICYNPSTSVKERVKA